MVENAKLCFKYSLPPLHDCNSLPFSKGFYEIEPVETDIKVQDLAHTKRQINKSDILLVTYMFAQNL